MNPSAATVRRCLSFGAAVVLALLAGIAGVGATAATAATAATSGGVHLSATIDGAAAGRATASHPIRLRPRRGTELTVTIANASAAEVRVEQVRLEGKVVGLSFFSYSVATDITVPASATETRRFQIDLSQLRGQAVGLIPAVVGVSGPRGEIAKVGAVVDVRGSLRSVYGVFGLTVVILTLMATARALLALARHRLSPNRFRRGLDFLVPGLGVGLFLVFTLSAFRVVLPQASHWVPILMIAGGVGFGLGYLTPSRDDEDDKALEYDRDRDHGELDLIGESGDSGWRGRGDGPLITLPSVRRPMSEGS